MPLVPTLGIISSAALMICGLGKDTWLRLVVWLAIGLVIYFAYGRAHSQHRTWRYRSSHGVASLALDYIGSGVPRGAASFCSARSK